MSIDYRALCADLLDEVAARPLILDRELIARARAALAEPVAEGPTDEEIIAFWSEHCAGDGDAGIIRLARYGHQPAERVATPVGPTDEDLLHIATVALTVSDIKPADIEAETELYLYGREVVEVARAALARYGHQSAPAAEGEVAELVAWLHGQDGWIGRRAIYSRIAALLEQRHPTPVPVSERLPEPEDCDAEERCWLLAPRWILPPSELTHWLPATALPLPQGEVQP